MGREATACHRRPFRPAGGCGRVRGAEGETEPGTEYKIVFDNAFGLTKGGDFRVGGVKAGKTSEFKAIKPGKGPPKAEVTAKISEPGFADFHTDATCTIKPQSLIGEYYVDCQPGSPSKPRLKKDGKGRVPVSQTNSTVPQDLVNNILRRPYKERLRLIINELGTGLAGRPDLQAGCSKRAHPGLRETSQTLQNPGPPEPHNENFFRDSDTVVSALEARKQEVTRWIDEAGDAAEITATRRTRWRPPSTSCRASWTSSTPPCGASASSPTSRSRCWPTRSARRRVWRPSLPGSGRSRRCRGPGPLAGQGVREGDQGIQAWR